MPKYYDSFKKKLISWLIFFMEHSFYVKESLKDKLQLFILRSFADIFSNEQSEPIISRKATDIVFCYNVKIQDFKLK